MKVSDIPVGGTLMFGRHRYNGLSSTIIMSDLLWVKAGHNNDFLAISDFLVLPVDESEPNASSRAHRENGNNFFLQSNLCQFLNASEDNWFSPQTESDVLSTCYTDRTGFLAWFDEWERQAIVPHEITVKTPNGFKRQFGEYTKATLKVSIPSASQLGMDNDLTEGDVLDSISIAGLPTYIFTRSAYGSGMKAICQNGNMSSKKPCQSYGIRPYIHINADCRVVFDDSIGKYIVLPPDHIVKEINDELDALLK